jgi:hypothetical protein
MRVNTHFGGQLIKIFFLQYHSEYFNLTYIYVTLYMVGPLYKHCHVEIPVVLIYFMGYFTPEPCQKALKIGIYIYIKLQTDPLTEFDLI